MSQLNLFPEDATTTTQLLFVNFGEKEQLYCLPILSQLRSAGISCEMYPDADKIKKQMNYANRKGVKYVAIIGENEMNNGKVTIKNMETGEQKMVNSNGLNSLFN